ncbi:hypothetical protein Efla_004412 [Eimeria flavescens]
MACLPAALSQFRDQLYWDKFFQERKGAPFEWYGTLKDFREALGALNLNGEGGPPGAEGEEGPLILHVGCGNSCLPKELYDEGYKRIVNVDFSPVVVEEMQKRYAAFPSLEWRCLDVRGRGLQEAFLGPPGGSSGAAPPFDVVLDKGFLDAYLAIDHEEAVLSEGAPQAAAAAAGFPVHLQRTNGKAAPYDYRKAAAEYFEAVLQLLKEGGSFVLISLAQDYVLKEFVRFFLTRHVEVEVFPCRSREARHAGASAGRLQPFLLRVKKKGGSPSSPAAEGEEDRPAATVPSCTMAGTPGRGGPETFPLWELTKRVAAVSRWQALDALACSQSPGKRVVLHVGGGGGTFARCNVAVYDSTNKTHAAKGQNAALLVPPGQELTWTFASPEGNQQVAEQLEAARLLLVTFPIGFGSEEAQEFPPLQWRKTIEEAQKTLGPLLKEFSLPNNDVIPILTLGEQAPVREVLWQEASPFAGRILVRDVQDTSASGEEARAAETAGGGSGGGGKQQKKLQKALLVKKEKDRDYQRLLRQLVFSCNSNTLQSEIKIRVPKGASSADEDKVEFVINDPASAYHCAVVAAFAYSAKVVAASWGSTSGIDGVLLGLGGGVLGGLLHYLFGHVGFSLTCVELDPIVIHIAKKFFGFKEKESPLLKVVCAEGKQYVTAMPPESVDFIILDLNSGESGEALICPPKEFAETDFLSTARQRLRPGGVLITNLLCRCTDTKAKLLDNIKAHFASLSVFHVPEDVNEVAVAVKESSSSSAQGSQALSASALLKRLQHLERCFLQHTGGKGGWLEGQSAKAWAGQMKPWPLPKSAARSGLSRCFISLRRMDSLITKFCASLYWCLDHQFNPPFCRSYSSAIRQPSSLTVVSSFSPLKMEHTKKTQATYTSQNGVYNPRFQGVSQHACVGAVTEVETSQSLVALTPTVTSEFVQNGHTVYFQTGFATRAGFTDEQYKQAGAHMLNSAEEVYKKCNIIVKVNTPQESEYKYIQPQQVIFCLMNTPVTTQQQQQQQQFLQTMCERRTTIINYSTLMNTTTTVTTTTPSFPVHNALSEIAGYLGVQQAMNLTGATNNGMLFGQVTGIPGSSVLILGAGACGMRAATLAAATGAQVTVMDCNTEALRNISQTLPMVQTQQYTQQNLEQTLPTVNTVIGCVIPTYTTAPTLVTDRQMQMMQQGSVAIDLAACAGGNFQATTPNTIQKPTYTWNGITMYTATNITCLAPQTTSSAFSLSAMPYMLQVANKGWKKAVIEFGGLQEGVCTAEGCVTNAVICNTMQLKYTPIEQVLENEIQQIGSSQQQQQNVVNLKQQLNSFRAQQTSAFTIAA